MGCSSCGTENGLPKGCKNNGACGVGGCEKLPIFDWLANMNQPVDALRFNYVEVRFKNDRKEYFHNSDNLSLQIGDVVAVESNPGHDIGVISLSGDLVRMQLNKRRIKDKDNLPKIYRKANEKDVETWKTYREKEHQIMLDSRRIAKEIGLEMKISDVEYQGDGGKATFYYTSDDRVDFRQLIRDFASAFKCRIEMRQIGFRQQAAKVGGLGSCGRELCCSTWLTDFRSVSTAAARYQQLSINPQKIAGQCGKLKCCLNFELDSYLDALKSFPKSDIQIQTVNGNAHSMKIDVFKREMWFAYMKSDNFTWYKFTVDQVTEFIQKNKNGEKIKPLEDLDKEFNQVVNIFNKDVIEDNSIKRFEKRKKKRRNSKGKFNQNNPNNQQNKGQNKQKNNKSHPNNAKK